MHTIYEKLKQKVGEAEHLTNIIDTYRLNITVWKSPPKVTIQNPTLWKEVFFQQNLSWARNDCSVLVLTQIYHRDCLENNN